ncbi:hypothetical protein Ancab_014749 [Ancistrocladus abbreviatus]
MAMALGHNSNPLIPSVFTIFVILGTANSHQWHDANWLNHGGDLHNRRFARAERKISPRSVSKLQLKWKFEAGKDITATPAIYKGAIYFPSWDGYVYALNATDGSLFWKQNLQDLTGIKPPGIIYNVNATVSRATPTIAYDLDLLIIGINGPAVVVALKRMTGNLVWSTTIDSHFAATITMSGTYYKG